MKVSSQSGGKNTQCAILLFYSVAWVIDFALRLKRPIFRSKQRINVCLTRCRRSKYHPNKSYTYSHTIATLNYTYINYTYFVCSILFNIPNNLFSHTIIVVSESTDISPIRISFYFVSLYNTHRESFKLYISNRKR